MLEIENTSDANNYGRAGPASPPPLPPSEPRAGVGAAQVPGVPTASLNRGASDTLDALQCPGWGEAGAGHAGRGCSCSGAAGVWGSRHALCQLASPPTLWAALHRDIVPCRVLFQVVGTAPLSPGNLWWGPSVSPLPVQDHLQARWWSSPHVIAGTLTKFTLVLYGTATDSPSLSNQLESSGCKTLTPSQTCVGECGASGEGTGVQAQVAHPTCTDPAFPAVCEEGYYLHQKSCLKRCPPGFAPGIQAHTTTWKTVWSPSRPTSACPATPPAPPAQDPAPTSA